MWNLLAERIVALLLAAMAAGAGGEVVVDDLATLQDQASVVQSPRDLGRFVQQTSTLLGVREEAPPPQSASEETDEASLQQQDQTQGDGGGSGESTGPEGWSVGAAWWKGDDAGCGEGQARPPGVLSVWGEDGCPPGLLKKLSLESSEAGESATEGSEETEGSTGESEGESELQEGSPAVPGRGLGLGRLKKLTAAAEAEETELQAPGGGRGRPAQVGAGQKPSRSGGRDKGRGR